MVLEAGGWRPEHLANVWRDVQVECLWMDIVRVLSNVAISLYQLQQDHLQCVQVYPDDCDDRKMIRVLQWNCGVAEHFDLLLFHD